MEEPSKFTSHGDANHNKLNNLVEHCLGGGTGNVMALAIVSRVTGVDRRHFGK